MIQFDGTKSSKDVLYIQKIAIQVECTIFSAVDLNFLIECLHSSYYLVFPKIYHWQIICSYYKIVTSSENYASILSKLRDEGVDFEPDNGFELLPFNPIEVHSSK